MRTGSATARTTGRRTWLSCAAWLSIWLRWSPQKRRLRLSKSAPDGITPTWSPSSPTPQKVKCDSPGGTACRPSQPHVRKLSESIPESPLRRSASRQDPGVPSRSRSPGMAAVTLEALDLAALLCSRVCHDVISPVGAIVNGLEVLEEDDLDMRDFALDLIRKSANQ